MGYLAAQGAILAIGIVIGLICSVIGLFFGHIILFDSIALGIVAGVCCNSFTPCNLRSPTATGAVVNGHSAVHQRSA